MEINSVPTVICRVCGKWFQGVAVGEHQAGGCACYYAEQRGRKFVLGCYGSEFDTGLYEFRDAQLALQWKGCAAICDECVGHAIKFKNLVQIEGDYPWGLWEFPDGVIDEKKAVPKVIPPMPQE